MTTTQADITRHVRNVIEASDFGEYFDVPAIVADLIREHGLTTTFSDDDFYEIVARHDVSVS